MEFFQTPPQFGHPYEDDHILIQTLKRLLPAKDFSVVEKDLKRFGDRVLNEMEELAAEAENHPPVHVPYSPWGKRIDEIKVSRAWERLHVIAAEEGIVSSGYERSFGEFSRLYQFAKLYLYHPSSAIYSCPLAMTDGAARLIEIYGTEEMKKRAYVHLTSRNPETFWTSGQWMTERTGGSDVSGTTTTAKREGDIYRLHGVKWFTSATTSQMAMTLAKIEGEDKLSLFYLELRNDKGELQNIQINRLKDKMGTKALPTAELTLNGTPAVLVGEAGKGVKTISTLFNITRLYNACCAVGYMRRGIALSMDYSKKRVAFGKPIMEHGLHQEMLADLQVDFEACFLMTMEAALLLGKEETGKASETDSGTLRLLIPLVKLFTAKVGVKISSEVIESFGGAGYVEDTGLPQILRNAQVLSIWEGTTNVLSLDALRAIKKENALTYFLKDMEARLVGPSEELQKYKDKIIAGSQDVVNFLTKSSEDQVNRRARDVSMKLSRLFCGTLLLRHAQWEKDTEKKERGRAVVERYFAHGMGAELTQAPQTQEQSQKILGL